MGFFRSVTGTVSICNFITQCAIIAIVISAQAASAGWQLSSETPISCNTDTTISLKYEDAQEIALPIAAGTLWLEGQGSVELLLPDTISYTGTAAAVPVFIRGEGTGELLVYDDIRKSSSVLTIESKNLETLTTSQWIPYLTLEGDEEQSVLPVNREATATLTLSAGTGAMPPSTHISVADHRGRIVSSQFHNTFDLVAGHDSIQMPAAGQYEVSLKLLNDAFTSLPVALRREPEAIPFGKTVADIPEPTLLSEGVTTQTVVGVRIALEHIPTTATIVGEDRLRVVALARQSKEIQKNKWPFVLAGAELFLMSTADRKDLGPKLVRWQRRLGSSFAPVVLEWGTIQKSAGMFQWSSLNSALPIYRNALVRPLVTVVGKSAWSQQLPTETSATLAAWTKFTRQLSEKHRDLIWGLQCWKFPEESWPEPNAYGKLVDATIDGFQMPNNERVPTPPLIIGGTQKFDANYFEPLLTSNTIKSISGISFDLQPKDSQRSPEVNGFDEILAEAADFIKNMNTDTIKLWVTGTGWPVGPDGVTEKLQANYLVRSHVMALSHGIYKFYWNSLADKTDISWEGAPATRMGLLNYKLFPKASGVAYNLMTYMMSGVEPIDTSKQGKVKIYKFNIPLQNNKWPGLLYVAWTESPGAQDVRLDMTHGGGVYALDYLGAEVQTRKISEDSANSINGSYSIPIGFEPVFIWDAGEPGQTNSGNQENQSEIK